MVDVNKDIDLSGISFATDGVATKDLRRMHPEQFDTRDVDPLDLVGEKSVYDRLAILVFCERDFAVHTYDQAREQFRDDGLYGEDLEMAREQLAGEYVRFGLAAGPAQAEEFVRSIERQSLQQAKEHGGPGRG